MRATTIALCLMVLAAGAAQADSHIDTEAQAGEMQRWAVDGGTHGFDIRLSGPDGELLRHWPAAHNGVQEVAWIAPRTGRYRLEAANPWFAEASAPAWRLQARGPVHYAPADAPQPPAVSSPLLLQLQERIALAAPGKKPVFNQNFWDAVQARGGAPLLEEIPQRPQQALVTFLWRAPQGQAGQPHRVLLEWGVRADAPFTLQQVPGTDIWQLSLPLPRGLRAAYQIIADPPEPQAGAEGPPTRMQRVQAQMLAAQPDALNPRRWHAGSPGLPAQSEAAQYAWRSALVIPENGPLRNAAQTDEGGGEPPLQGSLEHLRHDDGTNQRSLSVYLPPGAHAPGSLPLLLLFDREAYLQRARIDQRLERWMADGRIPPMAAVLVANPRQSDRAKELPPVTPAFGQMLAHDLLPWLRARYPALARDAGRVIVAGSSYGGLAAGTLAWAHPEAFGNALSLSGSYWWAPPGQEDGWFMRTVAQSPVKPVRFHLSWGALERGAGGEAGIADNSRHLRDVLQARGHAVTTHEYAGGHDYYAWGEELLIGLRQLLK